MRKLLWTNTFNDGEITYSSSKFGNFIFEIDKIRGYNSKSNWLETDDKYRLCIKFFSKNIVLELKNDLDEFTYTQLKNAKRAAERILNKLLAEFSLNLLFNKFHKAVSNQYNEE